MLLLSQQQQQQGLRVCRVSSRKGLSRRPGLQQQQMWQWVAAVGKAARNKMMTWLRLLLLLLTVRRWLLLLLLLFLGPV
jgi:hypothetical protein